MTRREHLGLLFVLPACLPGQSSVLRGKLSKGADGKAALVLPDGKTLLLEGDKATEGVLQDERLRGADLSVKGSSPAPGRFRVDPIHTKAMQVWKAGKALQISYWCEVCSIRTYTPGVCMCCQEVTELDLKESFEP